jgi:hypothetical protein
MLWGGGDSADPVDAKRLQQFAALPGGEFKYVLGFEEPDCAAGGGSAGMSVQQGAQVWNDYVAHKRVDGTLLGSPSMCHQAAETWLTPFEALISTPWDITNIHINKNSMTGVTADIDYYFNKYKKPWVPRPPPPVLLANSTAQDLGVRVRVRGRLDQLHPVHGPGRDRLVHLGHRRPVRGGRPRVRVRVLGRRGPRLRLADRPERQAQLVRHGVPQRNLQVPLIGPAPPHPPRSLLFPFLFPVVSSS